MEVERDIPDAPLETRDRLVLQTMQNVYRELKSRPHWYEGFGIAEAKRSRGELLEDWTILVNSVRWEVESATLFNVDIPRSDWPDIPACLVLGIQALLEGKIPKEPPPPLAVETWKIVCCFLVMELIEERQQLMSGYLEDFIKRHKRDNRIGPAFHPEQVVRTEAA